MTNAREKLIELLDSHKCPWLAGNAECPTGCNNCIADHLIANGVTVQEWIPVSDHLPQEDQPLGALCEVVQVLLNDGTVTVGICNRGFKCWFHLPIRGTSFIGHSYDNTPVVAWQPLSQPPKGE